MLNRIDVAIKNQDFIVKQKELFIEKIKAQLVYSNLTSESQYLIYKQLADEYQAYQADSLKFYAQKRLTAAMATTNKEWITDSKINMALVQAKSGFFHSAVDILDDINKKILTRTQLINYYIAYSDTYVYWMEFNDGIDVSSLVEKKSRVQDSLIQLLPVDSYEYAVHNGTRFIESGIYDQAEVILMKFLPRLKPDTRDYAVLTSLLAYLYDQKGNAEKQKQFLALSALADIKGAIMENTSLRTLALLLFNEGKVQRPNMYIKKCMDDANFFNARLRNLQTSRILPIIDKAYQEDKARQEKKLSLLLIIISILSFILLVAILAVIRQMFKLSKAQKRILHINDQLTVLNHNLQLANEQYLQTNVSLADANHIKEQFISNFLDICTEYIDKLGRLKQTIHLKVNAGQIKDVLRMTDSASDTARELKELYANFDRAFLNIYPNFIEEFNKLLRPEEQYKESADGALNHELRVFALIRLGITDSNKIATFLHYTLRTIYNYRSKVKSKALNQNDNFEEKVHQLCF
ncbi:DUF6377 domain-containing protein [Geofilum sp. OHC36d9]|uniref:DUF6377 domain-containing protein n=1 Tax=Geofilum sp. OHC36d9 TaxID=3458413 RepID=UPI0040345968